MKKYVLGAAGLLTSLLLEPTLCRLKGHQQPLGRITLNGQPTAICAGCGDSWQLSHID